MLLTLVNDNAGILNLVRVQPYFETGEDTSVDEAQDQTYQRDNMLGHEMEALRGTGMARQEKRIGVRFDETGGQFMGNGNGDMWQEHAERQMHQGIQTPLGELSRTKDKDTVALQHSLNVADASTPRQAWTSPFEPSHPHPHLSSGRSDSNDFTFTSTRDMKLNSRPSSSSSRIDSHPNNSRAPSRAPSLTDHDAALALEDMALNRNLSRDAGGVVGQPSPDKASLGINIPGTQPSWAKRIHVAGLEVLPPVAQAQPIINYFVSVLTFGGFALAQADVLCQMGE